MNRIRRTYWTAKAVGWDNLPRRLLHMFMARTGRLRRRMSPDLFTDEAFRKSCQAQVEDQGSLWEERRTRFFAVPSGQLLRRITNEGLWRERVINVCEKALAGEHLMFSNWYGRLGWPPDFNLDPVNGIPWPVDEHWTCTAKSGPPRDDIKLVWEASRLSLAYYFSRAHVLDEDPKWPRALWQMVDAWIAQNPCQKTVAWGCGQEVAFRLMAILFGVMDTLGAAEATDKRLYAVSRLVWRSGRRIEGNINYARSQENNHALSEALGLWSIGLLFPEFSQADRWKSIGLRVLVEETQRQVYDDGSYVQHSSNYHRVAMDDLLWCIRLGEMSDCRLPQSVYDRLGRLTDWAEQLCDPESGRLPNYGANDGALVLPLHCCDYLDYRPAIQACRIALQHQRAYAEGPWDEKALWLCGEQALQTPLRPLKREPIFTASTGGYYVLRGPQSWCMTRCHTFHDRPGQNDMLHLDLWCRGRNILRDGGSYRYYAQEPWKSWFQSAAAHNTVTVDGCDQMVKGPKFLQFCWTKSKLIRLEESGDKRMGLLQAEHYGYARLEGSPVHRRTILRVDDSYVIVDDVLGHGNHVIGLRWRLLPGEWDEKQGVWTAQVENQPYCLRFWVPDRTAIRMVRGEEGLEPEGWESLYYGRKQPAPTLVARCVTELPMTAITVVEPKQESESLLAEGHYPDLRPDAQVPLRLLNRDFTREELQRLAWPRFRLC